MLPHWLSLDSCQPRPVNADREGFVERKPEVTLSSEVECDEVYVVAGHKGHPEAVRKRAARPEEAAKGAPGRGTLAKEKPPIFGMIQRSGEVMIRMLADVKQKTIGPLIKQTITPGAVVYTDEYDIYARLPRVGLYAPDGLPCGR